MGWESVNLLGSGSLWTGVETVERWVGLLQQLLQDSLAICFSNYDCQWKLA